MALFQNVCPPLWNPPTLVGVKPPSPPPGFPPGNSASNPRKQKFLRGPRGVIQDFLEEKNPGVLQHPQVKAPLFVATKKSGLPPKFAGVGFRQRRNFCARPYNFSGGGNSENAPLLRERSYDNFSAPWGRKPPKGGKIPQKMLENLAGGVPPCVWGPGQIAC